jgi:LAO/AO transport system kinase
VTPEETARAIRSGDRRALARAITLVESTRPDHRRAARDLLRTLLPDTGGAFRLGITGPPGAGKSTFIEALGVLIAESGVRLSVLAIDPSSARSGGSILGDKTRMAALARRPEAFIRPTPAGLGAGGVARRTREALLLSEAWGAEVVIVETVGVGQAELAAADMVDQFLVLLPPGGGDDLQGIKRGIMELADLIVVTKADGDLAPAAERARADVSAAIGLLRPRHEGMPTEVRTCSALERRGVGEVWEALSARRGRLEEDGRLAAQRRAQARAWMWSEVREGAIAAATAGGPLADRARTLEEAVERGETLAEDAAGEILRAILREGPPPDAP